MTTTLTKRYMQKTILTIALTASCLGAMAQTEPIRIDLSQKGAVVSPNLYGIFFEEISHAGDGGLYAELVQNRGFEEHVLPSGMSTATIEIGTFLGTLRRRR